MSRIAYIDKSFRGSSLQIIAQANQICAEYAAQRFDLTLRQLYYQFVARDLLPNTQQSYKRLGKIINDARLAGYLDWDYIVDRTRNLRGLPSWTSPASIIRSSAYGYRIDKWAQQPYRIEVWIEKEALIGVFTRICNELEVDFFACRGYVSQSELWRAAERHISYERDEQETIVLHFGDHDPSGMDMTRDIQDRLWLFGANTEVRRIALNMDQIDHYQPPPNPAKLTDARAQSYIAEYGYESWELDALEPTVLAGLVEQEVLDLRSELEWTEASVEEDGHKQILRWLSRKSTEELEELMGEAQE